MRWAENVLHTRVVMFFEDAQNTMCECLRVPMSGAVRSGGEAYLAIAYEGRPADYLLQTVHVLVSGRWLHLSVVFCRTTVAHTALVTIVA